MAIYAIGDVHGHLQPLLNLLDIINFNPAKDQLWLVGDLVNRGPDSLGTLRFVRDLGDAAKPVLGNHDLHLLAVASGIRSEKPGDTLKAVLSAPDREDLMNWLRHQPFVHVDKSLKTLMVHAGVYIKWGRKKIVRHAQELESVLQGDNYLEFLRELYCKKTKIWTKSLHPMERYRFIANACIRMRFCGDKKRLDFEHKGPPGSQPDELEPWFRYPQRRCTKWRIIFGHWSTLGYRRESNVVCLDSGCLWGKHLTMIQLDSMEERFWQTEC